MITLTMTVSNKRVLIGKIFVTICFISYFLFQFYSSFCFAQSSLTKGDDIPGWIKMKFYQSYGYSWDTAPLEQRMRFKQYCERMQKQWEKEDRQYKKVEAQGDKRLKAAREKKARLRKYLNSLEKTQKKKEAAKAKRRAKQLKLLQRLERSTQKLIPRR